MKLQSKFTLIILFQLLFFLVYANNDVVVKEKKLSEFSRIQYNENIQLVFHKDTSFRVMIETQADYQLNVSVTVVNETLYLKTTEDSYPQVLKIHVYCSNVETLEVYKFDQHKSVTSRVFTKKNMVKASQYLVNLLLRM